MITVRPEQDVLVVSENGYGKRSSIEDYRVTNRGGKGVKTLNITEKTGNLISVNAVTDNDHLMIINRSGITIRLAVDTLRVMGRATQGVRLINLRDGDVIASVAKIEGGAELERIAEEEAAKIAQMEAEADGIAEPVTEEVVPEENNGAEIAEEENNENTNE
jgi:DNA gyrase subunit A